MIHLAGRALPQFAILDFYCVRCNLFLTTRFISNSRFLRRRSNMLVELKMQGQDPPRPEDKNRHNYHPEETLTWTHGFIDPSV
jgi:hypothetical protein